MSDTDPLAPPRDYLKAYSLTCEPFSRTLDGRFFYAGPALMQRLDLLAHLTQFGDSVILVSGPPGSGKTTLLGRFVAQTGRQWRLCLINADEFSQLKQRLGDALGIGEPGDAQRIVEQWAGRHDASQLLVIVIDNSQLLPPEALQQLCALLASPQGDRLRLILFGTPQAQQALKQALEQKELPCTAQLLEIPKLSEEETAAYLMYRLAVAGYSGESPFTAMEVRAICKAADGRPEAINRLAHEALLEHQLRAGSKRLKLPRPAWRINRGALGAASLLVVCLAVYLGWQRLRPESVPEQPAAPDRIATRDVPLALPEPGPEPSRSTTQVPAIPPPAQPVAPSAATPLPSPLARETAGNDQPGTEDAPAATPQRYAADSDSTTADAQIPETAPPPTASPPAPDSDSVSAPTNAASAKPATAEPPEPTATLPIPAPTESEGTKPAEIKDKNGKSKSDTDTAAAPTPAPASTTPSDSGVALPHREDWLLRQPADRYSLQLLGSRQEDSILAYIRQNGLDRERSAYYRGTYRGGDWYVLMYGTYPDRATALQARDALPAQVKQEKPWPRTLASVHTAIREAR